MPMKEYRLPTEAELKDPSTLPSLNSATGMAWFIRRMPASSALHKLFNDAHVCVQDDAAGTIDHGGLRLRPVQVQVFSSPTGGTTFFVVPKAAVAAGVASAAAMGGAPSGAAQVDPLRLTPLRIAAFCIKNEGLLADTEHRLAKLEAAVAAVADANVFIAPEDYLCRWVASPAAAAAAGPNPSASAMVASGPSVDPVAADFDLAMLIRQRMMALSAKFPAMLIIPGTLMFLSRDKTRAYNRAYVYLGGDAVCSNDQRGWYDKRDTSPERDLNLPFVDGPRGYFDFDFRELMCRLQICADSFAAPQAVPAVDLQIVISHRPGATGTFTHPKGCKLIVDGFQGDVVTFRLAGASMAPTAIKSDCKIYDVVIQREGIAPEQVAAALPEGALPAGLSALISAYT